MNWKIQQFSNGGRVFALAWAVLFAPATLDLRAATAPATAVPEPRRGGTLRLAFSADPRSLDPAQAFSDNENMLGFFICNTLVDTTVEGGFVPMLAESLPETTPDGLAFTFQLRRGVRFSTGKEMTAEDVRGSLERLLDPTTAGVNSAYLAAIKGSAAFAEARRKEAISPLPPSATSRRWIPPLNAVGLQTLDRYKIRIRLDKPDQAFLKQLATACCAIVSIDATQHAGAGFSSTPVGTGPFVVREWVRGARIRLGRNPHYYFTDRPRPKQVDILVNVDSSTQFMMFERGELDCQLSILDPDFARIKRTPSLRSKLKIITGTTPTFIAMNCEMPPFNNRLVRLALNHAVDKQGLVKLLGNRCEVSHGVVPFTVSNFKQFLPDYAYDPTRARALLAEAGFPNGFATTLWTAREDSGRMKIALHVRQCLREIGVKLEIKEVSSTALLDSSGRRGIVPLGIRSWSVGIDDPKEMLDSLLNGDNITDQNCLNTAFYANPRVQQWFRDAAAASKPDQRYEIYRRIERQVFEEAPWIFLVHLNSEMTFQPWLKGIQATGFCPPVRLEHCWLER